MSIVIETNIVMDHENNIHDIQSRVIEVNSWQEYIDMVLRNGDTWLNRDSFFGLNGPVKRIDGEIIKLDIDEHRMIYKFYNTKLESCPIEYKLAYLIDNGQLSTAELLNLFVS